MESDGATASTWTSVAASSTAGTYTVTTSPRIESLIGLKTMKLKITLANYAPPTHPGILVAFNI